MPALCLCFQVHQPCRLRHYTIFDVNHVHAYEDGGANLGILNKVADQCYLPANRIMLNLIRQHAGQFRIAFSISGILLDQLERHRPNVLESFQAMVRTGSVELL